MSDFSFEQDAFAYLSDLNANNNKAWFAENKPRYEKVLKKPSEVFAELMADQFRDMTGSEYDFKIFRIYRDVRFSKDKTPYNAHMRISFFERDNPSNVAWFFSLEPQKLIIGTGIFAFEKEQLLRYRNEVVSDSTKINDILTPLFENGFRLSEPGLKRVPSGFDKDHKNAELLRYKGLAFWLDIDDIGLAQAPQLMAYLKSQFQMLLPFYQWLKAI